MQEHFYVLLLDTKNNIIKEELISKGILEEQVPKPTAKEKLEISDGHH